MKAIYLLLLLVGFSIAQVQPFYAVPDTNSLKTMEVGLGSAVYMQGYSAGNVNGAGIYLVIDSAYTEGSYAFDHPTRGYQWYLNQAVSVANNAVDSSKIAAGAVQTSDLADSSITSAKIASETISMSNISVDVQNRIAGNKRINFQAYRTSEETVSASGDSTAWAAIEALLDDSTTVYFPAGLYNFTTADIATINASVVFQGEGMGKTVFIGDADTSNSQYFGIQKSFAAFDITFKNFVNAIYVLNTNAPDTTDFLMVERCEFNGGVRQSITASNPNDNTYAIDVIILKENWVHDSESGFYIRMNTLNLHAKDNTFERLIDLVADGDIQWNTSTAIAVGASGITQSTLTGRGIIQGNVVDSVRSTVTPDNLAAAHIFLFYGDNFICSNNIVRSLTFAGTDNENCITNRSNSFSIVNNQITNQNNGVVFNLKGADGTQSVFYSNSYYGTGQNPPTTIMEAASPLHMAGNLFYINSTRTLTSICNLDPATETTIESVVENNKIITNVGQPLKLKVDVNQGRTVVKGNYFKSNNESIDMTGEAGKFLQNLEITGNTFVMDSLTWIDLIKVSRNLVFSENSVYATPQVAGQNVLTLSSSITGNVDIINNRFVLESSTAGVDILGLTNTGHMRIDNNTFEIGGNLVQGIDIDGNLRSLSISGNKVYGDTLMSDTDGIFTRIDTDVFYDFNFSNNDFFGTDSIKIGDCLVLSGVAIGGDFRLQNNKTNTKVVDFLGGATGTVGGDFIKMFNTLRNTGNDFTSTLTVTGNDTAAYNYSN